MEIQILSGRLLRKTKRAVALALMMLLLTSVLAVPASAAGGKYALQPDGIAAFADGFIALTDDPVGLLTDLTPQYTGPTGGKFIAPIESPAAGSIPISNRAQLEAINDNLRGAYHLISDIDLDPALYDDTEWMPIGTVSTPFSGVFDGQGFVIRNLTITEDHLDAGLFGFTLAPVIKNVGLVDTYINISSSSNSSAGGICGFTYVNRATISNCYNIGEISSTRYAGGICGRISGVNPDYNFGSPSTISDCYNEGDVTAIEYASGISGFVQYATNSYLVSISNCYNTGNISADNLSGVSTAAGISNAPYYSSINNCYNTGDISASAGGSSTSFAYAGGISGGVSAYDFHASSISNCYNTGNIYATSPSRCYAGGISGSTVSYSFHPSSSFSSISNCYNTGEISSSISSPNPAGAYAGGISGFLNGLSLYPIIVSNCYNTGKISSTSNVGGISGDALGSSIGYCYNTGVVVSSSSIAGGICSFADSSSISYCYNTGDVSGEGFVGGICGSIDATLINSCYNTGGVSAVNTNPGLGTSAAGICGGSYGSNFPSINNCYNTGDVSAAYSDYVSSAGGIFAAGVSNFSNSNSISISNCYNTGDISAFSYAGGIRGGTFRYSSSSECFNCVALNSRINIQGSAEVGRITGISFYDDLSNNRAFIGMMAEGGDFPAPPETYNVNDNLNGTDIMAGMLLTAASWTETTPVWDGWDTDVWQIEDGKLPILKDVGGEQTGEPPAYLYDSDSPAFVISASALSSFGSLQTPYSQPEVQTATITNAGTGSIVLIQPTALYYDIGTLSTTSLLTNGAIATFTVRPKDDLPVGIYDETIGIYANDGAEATVSVSFAVTALPTDYEVTLTINKDGAGWDSHGKILTLRQDGETKYTGAGENNTIVFDGVVNGVYDVFDGEAEVGATVVIDGDNDSAVLNYFTVSFAVNDEGTANGSIIAATYNNSAITSGGVVFGGKELIITATGAGADSYTYAWSGTAGGTDKVYTVATLDAAVNAICTVTGATGGSIMMGDANGDGVVNMADVLLIYQHFRGKITLTGEFFTAADVNVDTQINMQDVLLVYQYFRGKISGFSSGNL